MVQRSSTRVVSTALIGPNTVVREGLQRILHGTHYKTSHVAESLNGGHFGHPLDLISFTLYSGRSDLLAQVHRAKGNGGTTRVVVMADDACPDDVRSLLSAGVDGYLSSDCAPRAVLATLDAVMVESLLPAQLGFGPTWTDADETAVDLAPLIDRLANRLGPDAVFRLALRESHIPERATRRVPATTDRAPDRARDADDAAARWSETRRPLRLLPHPEPIEATAPVPDGCSGRWR